ncbi:hypothetical protein CCY99_02895 [Helicobacter sp. 16-1353]|uniref:DUF3972 domain-containing protein n=1 Tax=Helicobacter sp. 16-1353 TaxID=2004996 RepID=UPI000DCD9A99|nr:DUF3972 domain-containing protein [Helicobacter sp. 16-1353]RAX54723.1 hypothetical protein CCY99_02895 [Helicobacter sp. 16-1353]
MKANWIKLEEFLEITGLSRESVKKLIQNGQINAKYINEILYVDSISGTNAIVKSTHNSFVSKSLDADFVEQSIGTILNLHEKVIEAKDETILAIKNENQFLKDSLISAKETQIDDKKTIESLKQEIQSKKAELEAINRKYKLMWGKMLNKDREI